MITFGEATYDDVVEELKPLLKRHWEELAGIKDLRPLDPDYDSYKKFADAGVLKIFTGRVVEDTGNLIAYSTWFVQPHLHYRTWVYAMNDIYYLDSAFRNKNVGKQFFVEQLYWLKTLGVNQVCVQDKLTQSHKQFFESMGFTHTENNYEMVI